MLLHEVIIQLHAPDQKPDYPLYSEQGELKK
jgi:hypothetical protein